MRLLVVAVALLVPTALRAAEPDAAEVRKFIADSRKLWDVPGIAVVVVRGDETLLLEGFGVREVGKPAKVTPDTVFPLASCTKAFTTTLLATLVDDGTLAWDDPVRKHLPGFKLSDPNADALLTVRDLLCHRCGIAGNDLLWFHAPWGIDEVVKRAQSLPLDYPFRGGYSYSSIPFLVAGRAIEKRTGETWEKLVRTRISEPLGMSNTYFTTPEVPKNAELALGYRVGKTGKVEAMPFVELTEPNPSGSVHSTARDVAAWLKFQLEGGIAPGGSRLVSVKNLNETKTPHNIIRREGLVKTLNPETVQVSYGLGWLIYDHRGKKVISHGGLYDGFRMQLTLLPDEKLGIAVLCNLHETRMNAALTNSLIDRYCELETRDWNGFFQRVVESEKAEKQAQLEARDAARDPTKKPSLALANYAGEYTHPAYGTASVTLKDGTLTVAWSSFTVPLEHFQGDEFRVTRGFFDDQIVPFTAKGGEVTTVRLAGQVFGRK